MKKKIFIFIFLASCFLLLTFPSFAQEKITSFHSDVKINLDASANITETIDYDFGALSRHGIFREIPLIKTNKKGEKYKLKLKLISVADPAGNPYQYKNYTEGNKWIIKIVDPDSKITGAHTYIITYSVAGNITYFSDHDEFYWNITGNHWQVPISSAQAVYTLPKEISEPTKAICFTGKYGVKDQYCKIEKLSATEFNIITNKPLASGEGLSTDISFPTKIIAYSEPEKITVSLLSKLISLLVALAFFLYYVIAPFFVVFLYFKYGRDPKVGIPVTAWYDPPQDKSGRKLTPAETGTLIDEFVDDKEISATIVSLAIKGYLKIEKKGKHFGFYKKKDFANAKLQSHEKLILNRLFELGDYTTTKDLKNSFYLTADKFKKNLYQKMVELNFFPKNPDKVRKTYYALGVLALITGNIVLAVLLFVLGRAMPAKTLFGAQQKNVAQGIKNFLTTQERQLEFQAKNWHFFEKLLPFAIAFGVEKVWAQRFKDLKFKQPDWYDDPSFSGAYFNTVLFTSALSSSMRSVHAVSRPPSTATTSTSGFSSGFGGGGFYGGGGGGGGGGSW